MDRTEQLALPARRDWRSPPLRQAIDILTQMADTCLHPLVVLPLFVVGLAGAAVSPVTIGFAVASLLAAEALGSALAAALALERRARLQLNGLLVAVGTRALILFGLASVGTLLQPRRAPLLDLPLVPLALLAGAALLGGFAASLRPEIGDWASPETSLTRLRRRRPLVGALAVVAGALLARGYLSRTDASFPAGWVQLFGAAGLLLAPITLALVVLPSPPPATTPPIGGRAGVTALPDLLVNNLAYGRFVLFRVVYALGALADPFYILYATQELGATGRTAGAYLLTLAVARAAGTAAWRALGARGNNPMVLQLAAFVRLLAPIIALTLPPLLLSATLRERLPGGGATGANLVAFGLVFAAYGVASAGIDLAAPAIQATTTTPRERIAATTATQLALAAAALSAPLGGLVVDRFGFPFLFVAALLAGLAGLLAGGLVDEPGAVVLRAPASERLPARRVRRGE